MSAIKKSTFWSTAALAVSVIVVLAMAAVMVGYFNEAFTFREASGHLRTVAQVSVFILGFSVLVALLSWKNRASLIKALLAAAIVLAPLLLLKTNMPEGTALFASAPSGPPPSGAGKRPVRSPSESPINDVSTDTQNPPVFAAVIPLREEKSNAIEYAGKSAAEAQAAQYPDIKPIESSLGKSDAFNRALEIANDMGLEIVAQDSGSGIIEAIASTRFFKFKDDVIIRISENGANSIVDIRSHSRIGRGDRGKNAERVRTFISKF